MVALTTTHLDAGADSPRLARAELLASVQAVNQVRTDWISVREKGAVGDGSTDDTVAIQAAIDTGRGVYFPVCTGYYRTSSALNVGYSPRLRGDRGISSIIRNVSGSGAVFNFAAVNEHASIEHLRIGGAGCTGIQVSGGGYANYLSTLAMRHAHFEADLALCVDANLIYFDAASCTFGYFVQTGAHASHRHIKTSFSGGLFTNLSSVRRSKFFRGAAGQASVDLNAGVLWRFTDCDWSLNGRILQAANISGLILDNCYSEQNQHATSLIDLATSRTRVKIIGGSHTNSGTTPSFIRYSDDTPLLLEDVDIATGAAGYVLTNTTGGAHTIPAHGRVRVKDNRIQGNASDPLRHADSAWDATLAPKGWAIINTAGSASIVASSDAGLSLSRNGTGDVNINWSNDICTAATKANVVVTGQDSYAIGVGVTVSTCRVLAYLRSAPATAKDDILQVVVWGK
jgi:hypothetical protein